MGPSWLWWVDAGMAAVALVLAVRGAHRRRRTMGPEARLLMLGLHMTLLVIALGSVEAISQGAPVGVRNYAVLIATLWVLLGLTWNTPPMARLRARMEQGASWVSQRVKDARREGRS